MSTPSDGSPHEPVQHWELADLRAGVLTPDEEARLRMRMQHDPDVDAKMALLEGVDAFFPAPPDIELPADMPPDVAARLQMRLAIEAARRAQNDLDDPDPDPDPDLDDPDPPTGTDEP